MKNSICDTVPSTNRCTQKTAQEIFSQKHWKEIRLKGTRMWIRIKGRSGRSVEINVVDVLGYRLK
jgi:hypothetical protein